MNETMPVHIFSAAFSSQHAAMQFSEPIYRDDAEPECQLWSAIGYHADGDFVETIYGVGRYEYLRDVLAIPGNSDAIRLLDDPLHNTLILVYSGNGCNEDFTPMKIDGPVKFLATLESNLR